MARLVNRYSATGTHRDRRTHVKDDEVTYGYDEAGHGRYNPTPVAVTMPVYFDDEVDEGDASDPERWEQPERRKGSWKEQRKCRKYEENRIKELRIERGWSQADLARRTGLCPASVKFHECDHFKAGEAAKGKYCIAFELSVKEIFPNHLHPVFDESADIVPNRIRDLRMARGWKIKELAIKAGLKYSMVYKMEVGEMCYSHRLLQVAEALGVSIRELMGDPEP